MRRQLSSMVNFGMKDSSAHETGKVELIADNYDFKLILSNMKVDGDNRKTFEETMTVDIKREELNELNQGFFKATLARIDRDKFNREKDMSRPLVDIKYVTKGLVGLRMVCKYVANGAYKNRVTRLTAYKLTDWGQVREFNKDADAFKDAMKFSFVFSSMPVSRGSFVSKDLVQLEEICEVMTDVYYKRSYSYVNFLEEVRTEANADVADNGRTIESQKAEKQVTNDDDEFPF